MARASQPVAQQAVGKVRWDLWKTKVSKQSLHSPGQALRVPEG